MSYLLIWKGGPGKVQSRPTGYPSSMQVPLDVVGIVMDQFSDDKVTLCDLSLVSKSWWALAIRLLFRRIQIVGVYGGFDFTSFIEFITNTQYLAERIQSLTLTDSTFPFNRQHLELRLLQSLFAAVPNLKSLHISYMRFLDIVPPLLDKHPSLTELSISSIGHHNDPIEGVVAFLSLFSKIDTLIIRNTVTNLDYSILRPEDVQSVIQLPYHLQVKHLTLFVSSPLVVYILNALSHTRTAQTLQSVDANTFNSWDGITALGSLLSTAGPNLSHIYINCAPSGLIKTLDATNCWRALNLDRCTNLQSITFGLFVAQMLGDEPDHLDDPNINIAQCRAFLDLLTLPTSENKTLRKITLQYKFFGYVAEEFKDARHMDWNRIRRVLSSIRGLDEVRVELPPDGAKDCKEVIEEQLSELLSRGILHVETL